MDEAEPQEAVSLVIAIQSGRSALYEFQRMKGISSMLDQIVSQPQVQTAIVVFDNNVELAQDFTFESDGTEEYLKSMMEGPRRNMEEGDRSGAAIYDAVRYSVNLLKKQPEDSRRVLLLISETRDHGSHAVSLDDTIRAISESNTVMYSLAFSPTASTAMDTLRGEWDARTDPAGWNLDILRLMKMARQAMRKNAAKSVASMSGGEYELFTSQKSFERLMNEFANHLHSRYLLRFEPKNPHPGPHEVRVRLRGRGNAVVLARRSYWVEDTDNPGNETLGALLIPDGIALFRRHRDPLLLCNFSTAEPIPGLREYPSPLARIADRLAVVNQRRIGGATDEIQGILQFNLVRLAGCGSTSNHEKVAGSRAIIDCCHRTKSC